MAEVDQIISFTFSSHHYIELAFDSLQNDSLNNGWTIQPLVKPCRVSACSKCNHAVSKFLSYTEAKLIDLMNLIILFLHLVWYQFMDHLVLYHHYIILYHWWVWLVLSHYSSTKSFD